jgi:hypothetical protein
MAVQQTVPSELERRDDDQLARATVGAERQLVHQIGVGLAVAVPLCTAVVAGIWALAIALSSTATGFGVPLAVAAGLGVLAGLFFGVWFGILSTTTAFEELDREALLRHGARPPSPPSADPSER